MGLSNLNQKGQTAISGGSQGLQNKQGKLIYVGVHAVRRSRGIALIYVLNYQTTQTVDTKLNRVD